MIYKGGITMKNSRSHIGSIYLARIYNERYAGRRLVLVVEEGAGMLTVLPVRTANYHRSSPSSVMIENDHDLPKRKVSIDCGRIISIRKEALIQQISTVPGDKLDDIRHKIQ